MGKRKKGTLSKYGILFLMTVPGMAYMLINNYVPMSLLFIAFKDVSFSKGFIDSPWNGIDNFKFLFRSPDFWTITKNTILYNLVFLVLNMVLAILVAVFLAGVKNKLMLRSYQSLIMLPHLMSMVIVSYIVFALLSTETGLVNKILATFGMKSISWYSQPQYWPYILTIVNIWHKVGYITIIYLAAILGIDQELFDSAALDGASKFQQLIYVTLPSIKETIIVMALLNIGKIFSSDFGLFYQVPMNSGPLFKTTNVITTYIYRAFLIDSNVGMSSAAGLYQSLVGFVLVLATNLIIRKIDKESALF